MVDEFNKEESIIDDASRIHSLRDLLQRKLFLRFFYLETYKKYQRILEESPKEGIAIEMGSGASFAKLMMPELVSSDIIPYEGVDRVIDATKIPLAASSLRAIFMMNTFHHISDVEAFLSEAERCLVPGGKLFIVDQHVCWLSRIFFQYLHHEPFDANTKDWRFSSRGPLSSANGAIAWIVFCRDRARFEARFPQLQLKLYRPHTPFRYWLAGGLKRWWLLPGRCFHFVTRLERLFLALFPNTACFVDILVEKKIS